LDPALPLSANAQNGSLTPQKTVVLGLDMWLICAKYAAAGYNEAAGLRRPSARSPQPKNQLRGEEMATTATVKQVSEADLDHWFASHVPNQDETRRLQAIREQGKQFARTILTNLQPGPDQTAAIRKVREAVYTANAGIMYEQA
jgi:hypothetical protein